MFAFLPKDGRGPRRCTRYKRTVERSFLGGMVSEPEFRRRRTTRDAWLIQRVHENHAARALGISDGGVISIRPRRGGPLAVVGHLSMYIQTETMSQSLIPTRGAACRREPLERARSNRRASRWTGSGRRHAGRVSQKRKPPLRAGRAGGGRVAHGGASSGVPGSQGMPQKRTSPGSLWIYFRRRPGNGVFWAAWFQNPNFAPAHAACIRSFKGFPVAGRPCDGEQRWMCCFCPMVL